MQFKENQKEKEKEKNKINQTKKMLLKIKLKAKEIPKAKSEYKATKFEKIINLLKKKSKKQILKNEVINLNENIIQNSSEDYIEIKDDSIKKKNLKENFENITQGIDKTKNNLKTSFEEIQIIEDEKGLNNIKNNSNKLMESIPIKIINLDKNKEEQNSNKKELVINLEQDSTDENESDYEKFINLVNESNTKNKEIYSDLNSLIQKYGYKRIIYALLLKSNFNTEEKNENNKNIFNFEKYMKNKEFKTNFYQFKDILNEALFKDYNSLMMNSNNISGMKLNLNLINSRKNGNKIHCIERIKGDFKECIACSGDKKEKVDYYCNTCKMPIHPECFVKYHNKKKLNFI